MSPEHFKPDQFKNDLKRVLSLIRTSQRYLEDGKVVELSALETKVADLCAQARSMNPEQRSDVTPLLAALTDELATFETNMEIKIPYRVLAAWAWGFVACAVLLMPRN